MDKEDYKKTLTLPTTDFPMKAALAEREPGFLEMWEKNRIYERALEQADPSRKFVFHDGPPYANGGIHYGHILNKVLKDIVTKYRLLEGNRVHYIPGWDCHGLPIEIAVEKAMGKAENEADKLAIRKRCSEFAHQWVEVQRGEIKRLGCFSLWDESYLTLRPSYEREIVRSLAVFVEKGMVYRGRKPVYWCTSCQTALAEAEVEYKNHKSPSIYVRYAARDDAEFRKRFGLEGEKGPIYVVIWTTTPWTLPASLAIAVHPGYRYRAYRDEDGSLYILAEDLAASVMAGTRRKLVPAGVAVEGEKLEKLYARHPFLDRDIVMLNAEYVTLDAGTGCVHTAPGHGQEDYVLGSQHGLDPYAPVDEQGKFTPDVLHWAGLSVWKANPLIVAFLHEQKLLLNRPGDALEHSYPCCWRCKEPIVFRATPQWFISMDQTGLRRRSLEEIDKVRWIPSWGRDRIYGMVENRPDWCISRQRAWGVPLPFFFCASCSEPLVDAGVVRHVADIFGREGSNAWFTKPALDLLPPGVACRSCGGREFKKEENIVDVWFESGVSWAAVCRDDPRLGVPVDLYLEGSDQHRGWFHTALLTGVGVEDRAPYKAVLTHGFVLNEQGEPLSKSQKNYVPPEKIIGAQGAELFRLWVAYEDYRSDIRFSSGILKSLTESYRKIRNTFRFLLGNISDFDPDKDAVPYDVLEEIDRWMLSRFARYLDRVIKAYEDYEFHAIFHATVELTTVELSAFYLDVAKDRLYCDLPWGARRRASQTVIRIVARDLARVLAPILSFTAEDVWQHLPGPKAESVFLAGLPEVDPRWRDEEILDVWNEIREIRSVVTKRLEEARRDGLIGHSLDAKVEIGASGRAFELLERRSGLLPDLFIVSQAAMTKGEGDLEVRVGRADGVKCARCWNYRVDVGARSDAPDICSRCGEVVRQLQERGVAS